MTLEELVESMAPYRGEFYVNTFGAIRNRQLCCPLAFGCRQRGIEARNDYFQTFEEVFDITSDVRRDFITIADKLPSVFAYSRLARQRARLLEVLGLPPEGGVA